MAGKLGSHCFKIMVKTPSGCSEFLAIERFVDLVKKRQEKKTPGPAKSSYLLDASMVYIVFPVLLSMVYFVEAVCEGRKNSYVGSVYIIVTMCMSFVG